MANNAFRGVILDMDGVIVDSEPFIKEAAARMFAERGYTVQAEEFDPFVGTGEDNFLGGVARKHGFPIDLKKDKARTYAIYLDLIPGRLRALPGVFTFIETCRQGRLKLALASSADAVKVKGNLEAIGLKPEAFDFEWLPEFLDFCEQQRLPADFVSTHHYPTDALGNEDEDTRSQLAQSQRSLLRENAQDSHRRARGKPLYYTEWAASSNPRDPLHDEPYAAAVVVKTMMEARGLVDGYSFWTFTDVFEETYFPSVPFHGGFGLLNLHGIPKPAYRAFELLHRLGTEQLLVDGLHETMDAWVVRRDGAVTVLLSNHALPDHPIATERVHVRIAAAPRPRDAWIERIDVDHANPKRLWQEMGEPTYLSDRVVEQLMDASRVVREPQDCTYQDGTIHLELDLGPHAVAAVTIELPDPAGERR